MEINGSTDAQKIVDKWLHLQKIIKEEITLSEISNLNHKKLSNKTTT
jgi:hypothetical protein